MMSDVKKMIGTAYELIFLISKFFTQGILYWIYVNFRTGMTRNIKCLDGKTAIVTGGNSGIGYMTSKLLASRGCRVIIACRRNAKKEVDGIIKETNNPNVSFKHLDLCSFSSVRKFAEEVRNEEKNIDILINNAGIGYTEKLLSTDGQDMLMQSNFLGHFLLTHLLIDLLRQTKDARVVFVTSGLANIHNISADSFYPKTTMTNGDHLYRYSNSKAAMVFAAEEMAEKVAENGIKVNAADPGIAVTPIFEPIEDGGEHLTAVRLLFNILVLVFGTDIYRSAQTSFHLAASDEIESGHNYFRCIPMPKLKRQIDKQLRQEIWKEAEKLVNLSSDEKL